MRSKFVLVAGALSTLMLACGDEAKPKPDAGEATPDAANPNLPARMSLAELQDPQTCRSCHPKHYEEWSRSMHAYAAVDPVFLAMNKRGQRETNKQMGSFCVECHAPMAVRLGLTTDGLNLDQVPKAMQGVTCYFCHNAVDSGPDHFNANVTLAMDDVMRGAIRDAVEPGVHGVAYNEAHDNRKMKASQLCGSCHDVVNQKGAHIEQTFAEYKASFLNVEKYGANGGDTCQGCHMPLVETTQPIAQVPASLGLDLPARKRHGHSWPAVDVALTDFPDREKQRLETECELSADGAYVFQVLHDGQGGFKIDLETTAGHAQPSGVAQDRRMWLQVIAYDAQGNVEWSSGVIGDQELEEYPAGDPKHDPQLCMFRNHFEDEQKNEVHMFWEAAAISGTKSKLLPVGIDPLSRHIASCNYRSPTRRPPARLSIRMRMRPMGMDVLQSLIDSGDLDPAIKAQVPTFTIHTTHIEWTPERGNALVDPIQREPSPITCSSP